jgi:rhodanese-related sulfurtransferase
MIKELLSRNLIEYTEKDDECILLDVRTDNEWKTVGKPDGDKLGLKTYFLSIKDNLGSINENFLNDFENLEIGKNIELAIICRSGMRSALAANILSKANYKCINVIDGFEGNDGWLNLGLPVK